MRRCGQAEKLMGNSVLSQIFDGIFSSNLFDELWFDALRNLTCKNYDGKFGR